MIKKIEQNGISAYFQLITPSIAADHLAHNIKNRRIDKNRVSRYLEDMRKGYWCCNGDAIRFDKRGNLIDGQHRLSAVKLQDQSFLFLVIENVDDDSKRTIDIGKSRTGGDVLALFSNVLPRDAGTLSASIIKLILYSKGMSVHSSGGNAMHTSVSAIEDFYKRNYVKLHRSLEFINRAIAGNAVVLSRSEALFLHYIFAELDAIEADKFMLKILTGINVEQNSNEFLARNILIKRSLKTLKIKPYEVLYTVIKAWNRNKKGGAYSSEGNLRYGSRDDGYPLAR